MKSSGHSTRWRRLAQATCRQPPTGGGGSRKPFRLAAGFAVAVLSLKAALLLGFGRGIPNKFELDSVDYPGSGAFMPGITRLLLALVGGCAVLTLAPATAAVPEWNAVRTHPVQLGPEASRLVVGFRATPGNAVVKAVQTRARTQSINIVQANTSDADVAGLALRTGLPRAP